MARRPSSVRLSVCKLLRKSLLLADKWPDRHQTCTGWSPGKPASRMCSRSRSRSKVTFFGFLGMSYSVIDGLVRFTFPIYLMCLFFDNFLRVFSLLLYGGEYGFPHSNAAAHLFTPSTSKLTPAHHCTERVLFFRLWLFSVFVKISSRQYNRQLAVGAV